MAMSAMSHGIRHRTRDDFLEAIVAQICQQMFSKKDRVSDLLLIEIPDHSFVHGSWLVGGRTGSLIYFKDAQIGIIAVPNKLSEKAEVNYARFKKPMKGKAPANISLT